LDTIYVQDVPLKGNDIDLEKANDRISREVLKWAIMRKEVPKKYINLIQDMYEGLRSNVKSLCRATEGFNVKFGVHQGSALSPYLFSMAINEITKDIPTGGGTMVYDVC
jgi:hypothetical protein